MPRPKIFGRNMQFRLMRLDEEFFDKLKVERGIKNDSDLIRILIHEYLEILKFRLQ